MRILVMTNRVCHAKEIKAKLDLLGVDCDIMAGNKKEYEHCRVLIGTISKIGTGFDEAKACKNFSGEPIGLMIVLFSTKSNILIEQTSGRIFRHKAPNIIYFLDNASISKGHWYTAKKWYKSRDANIIQNKNMKEISEEIYKSQNFILDKEEENDWNKLLN